VECSPPPPEMLRKCKNNFNVYDSRSKSLKLYLKMYYISINTFQLSIGASTCLMCKSVKVDQPLPPEKIPGYATDSSPLWPCGLQMIILNHYPLRI